MSCVKDVDLEAMPTSIFLIDDDDDDENARKFHFCNDTYSLPLYGHEAQLSQRGRAMLRVVGNFAKSLKITQDHSKLHR